MSVTRPRALDVVLEAQAFADAALVSVDERIQWERGVFMERARTIGARDGLPAWRVDELERSLARQHAFYLDGGMQFDEALAKIDEILASKAG